jgi:hypothetical protein
MFVYTCWVKSLIGSWYDTVRQSVTSKSKRKTHGPITDSDQNRSERVRAYDRSMLFAFAFARKRF